MSSADIKEAWERLKPEARSILVRNPHMTRLVMLITQEQSVFDYRYDSGELALEFERVMLDVSWDLVSEPYKSAGFKGCLISHAGVFLDRLEWAPLAPTFP